MGLDPGLRATGFGVLEKSDRLIYMASGCIKTKDDDLPARLKTIWEGLREIIATYQPQHVAVEKVFVNVNPQSTLLLGQARGVAICAAVADELAVFEYTALQVKQAVVGNGHAKKEQVQEMVKRLLELAGGAASRRGGCAGLRHLPRPWRHGHGGVGDGGVSHEKRETYPVIGRLSGRLIEKQPPQVIVDVQGLGYEVDVPMSTFYNLPGLGEAVILFTHLVVREDAHLLYGFGTDDERRAFRQLLKISGVGPKLALSVLSGLSVADLAQAVAMQETGRLVKIPGVGKKTAERLVLELRDKLDHAPSTPRARAIRSKTSAADVLNALLALGYNDREAQWALKQIPTDLGVSESIRQALKQLSKS